METGEPNPERPYPGFLQGFGLILEFFAVTIIAALPFIALGMAMEMKLENEPAVSALGVCAATAWILGRYQRRTQLGPDAVAGPFSLPLNLLAPIVGFVAGLVMAELPLLLWTVQKFPWLDPKDPFELEAMNHPAGALLYLVLAAPLTEELIFRGVLLRGFAARYGATRAILYSAALFALVHFYPVRYPTTFVMGLVAAWLTLRTGTIWCGLAAHVLNNTIAYAAIMTTPERTPAQMLEQLGSWSPFLVAGGVTLVAASLLVLGRMPVPASTASPTSPAD